MIIFTVRRKRWLYRGNKKGSMQPENEGTDLTETLSRKRDAQTLDDP